MSVRTRHDFKRSIGTRSGTRCRIVKQNAISIYISTCKASLEKHCQNAHHVSNTTHHCHRWLMLYKFFPILSDQHESPFLKTLQRSTKKITPCFFWKATTIYRSVNLMAQDKMKHCLYPSSQETQKTNKPKRTRTVSSSTAALKKLFRQALSDNPNRHLWLGCTSVTENPMRWCKYDNTQWTVHRPDVPRIAAGNRITDASRRGLTSSGRRRVRSHRVAKKFADGKCEMYRVSSHAKAES